MGVPWVRYYGKYKALNINVVCPGKDKVLGVDSVGTVSASLLTYASILPLQPDLIINAGTAGGLKEKGASIGDVFLASDVAFHDRRIRIPHPRYLGKQATKTSVSMWMIPVTRDAALLLNAKLFDSLWTSEFQIGLNRCTIKKSTSIVFPHFDIQVRDLYGVGSRQAFCTPNLVKELKLKVGKLSTGNSLDMSPQDAAAIIANGATVKDMEGAAIAYVGDLLKVPTIFLKAVTDIVGGGKPTAEECLQNLATVTAALDQAAFLVVDFINGKTLSEL